MKYNKIRKMDISNGPGVRVSLFVQGCVFNCPNCFNPETHDFTKGEEFNDETIQKVLTLGEAEFVVGLSILGGEPMHPINRDGVTLLAKAFKEKFPDKSIWMWTGYLFDQDLKDLEILQYIDVIVDGQYVDALHDFRLEWKGSSNQRVIDVKKSITENQIILYA
jgi:anaerobic ribonucleoside-triphosphate reductase activating protein